MDYIAGLFDAVVSGSDDTCALLLQDAPSLNINFQDGRGETMLHKAVVKQCDEKVARIVNLLLSRGADVHIKSNDGISPLEQALHNCDVYCLILDYLWLNCLMTTNAPNVCRLSTYTLVPDISFGLEPFPIPLKNYTSQVIGVIPKFYYTTRIIASPAISEAVLLDSPIEGCRCSNGCLSNCPCLLKGNVRYSSEKTIDVDAIDDDDEEEETLVLSECVDSCTCSNCSNKITDCASQFPVEVYFVSNQVGFALRTTTRIPKGSFITHYCGKLVDTEFATRVIDDSYLFDIPCSTTQHLMVDSKNFGNFSRFINHSCVPNLVVVETRSHSKFAISKLAFFAEKDIEAGFQLCFDYGKEFWTVKSATLTCKCGSSQCRYQEISFSDATSVETT